MTTTQRLWSWLGAVLMVAGVALFGMMWGRSWLGMRPYGGKVDGTVVSKNTIVHQTRYGTRLEYFVRVSSREGAVQTAVPYEIYSLALPGSTLHQEQNVFRLTTPDGSRTTTVTAP